MLDGHPGKDVQFEREALVHLDTLYGVALRLTGNPADADDLVQEAVIRAYRSWDRYEPGTNCRAWLVTILRNLFINDFRRDLRRPDPVEFEAVQDTSVFDSGEEIDPEEMYFDGVVDGQVVRAIRELPEEFRTPIVLSDVEGLSYAEIALALALPVGTVKSRLYRARRRLQARLREYALDSGIACGP